MGTLDYPFHTELQRATSLNRGGPRKAADLRNYGTLLFNLSRFSVPTVGSEWRNAQSRGSPLMTRMFKYN